MSSPKKILVCPLDWGIGHASRCVPLIHLLFEKGVEVLPVATGRSAAFLASEFPGIEIIDIDGYNIHYPKSGSMAISMLRQAPGLMQAIKREHRKLEQIVGIYQADAVISDNRFGMWSQYVPSVYITHQIMIKTPGKIFPAEKIIRKMHRKYISNYNECWIPDIEDENNLSGDLAHLYDAPIPSYFIGPQSRFSNSADSGHEKKYDIMVIISGPEPQRTIFEEIVLSQLRESSMKALVLLGKPEMGMEVREEGNSTIYSHMNSEEMRQSILSSGIVICRPGYSTIMDLSVLGKPAIFVPTPGQTEQEYLADYHQQKHHFYSVSQKDFNLKRILQAARNYPGLSIKSDNSILSSRIDQLLSHL